MAKKIGKYVFPMLEAAQEAYDRINFTTNEEGEKVRTKHVSTQPIQSWIPEVKDEEGNIVAEQTLKDEWMLDAHFDTTALKEEEGEVKHPSWIPEDSIATVGEYIDDGEGNMVFVGGEGLIGVQGVKYQENKL